MQLSDCCRNCYIQSEVTYLNFSYPNTSVIRTCLEKPHPPFPATLVDEKLFKWPISSVSGLALPVVQQLKTQDNIYGQGRLRNKGERNCQTQPPGTTGLPHEIETKQWLTVVRILVLT